MNKFQSYSRILPWFMALLLSALAAGCGGGGGDGGRDPILGTGVPGLVSLAVTPATASIPVTGTQQYTATATFADGSSRNVTATSTWTAVNVPAGGLAVARLSPDGVGAGLATGDRVGQSTITATFGGLSGSATLTVNAAISTKFEVIPATASIPLTGTQQFAAIETFSDGTSFPRTAASVWTAVDLVGAGVATVETSGVPGAVPGRATGNAVGQSTIRATLGVGVGAQTATATLTVTPAISVSFQVRPPTAAVGVTGTQQFQAIETFNNGIEVNRTAASAWTAVDLVGAGVATVETTGGPGTPVPGRATGNAVGQSTIRATLGVGVGAQTATAILTVTAVVPPPSILRSASTYGMIASDAMTVADSPLTHIFGDVALINNDSFVGFTLTGSGNSLDSIRTTPRTIPGINSKTLGDTAAAVQAQADLVLAFANLRARTPTTTFVAGAKQLSGLVLTPGVYKVGTAAASDTYALDNSLGPVVLDAQGDPDAVFVFQAGNITTTTGSVILQGGAQPKNVFWVMEASAVIGNGVPTIFQGTVVAGITITVNGANVQGRMLAGATGSGAITANSVITVPAP